MSDWIYCKLVNLYICRLQSKAEQQQKQPTEYNPDRKDITDYRRKGVLKQRRLSRINLGKQLALSETSGLKLQWIVDFQNYNNDNTFM